MPFYHSHHSKSVWLASFLFVGTIAFSMAHAQNPFRSSNNEYLQANNCVATGEVESANVLVNGTPRSVEWRYYQCDSGLARL